MRHLSWAWLLLAPLAFACSSAGEDAKPAQEADVKVADSSAGEPDRGPEPAGDGRAEDDGQAPPVDDGGEPDPGSDDGTGRDAEDASADAEEPPLPWPAPGPGFHRDGSFLLDAEGRVLVLHGLNVSNYTKHIEDHMTWHGAGDFPVLAEHGLSSIRLLVVWAALMPAPGEIDEAYLDALAQRVEWAHEAGLLVILDMHQDVFGYGFEGNGAPLWACSEEHYAAHEPATPWWRNYASPQVQACFDHFYGDDEVFGHFRDAWRAVGARFGQHPAVVGFDLLNEPYWGSHEMADFVPEVWQPRMEEVAAALREVAPARIVFFEGIAMAGLAHVDAFVPAADPRTALAPHYYHPLLHEGVAYRPVHLAQVHAGFDAIAEMAQLLGGVPVWLGEFGVHTHEPSQYEFLDEMLRDLARRRWSWAYWSDDRGDRGFSFRDSSGAVKVELARRLGHPYARRVPGPLLEQAWDPAEASYFARFRWTRDAALEVWAGPPPEEGSRPEPKLEAGGEETPECLESETLKGLWHCAAPSTDAGLGEEWSLRVQ